jgi:uncharacterized coiled-coil protein SlyX
MRTVITYLPYIIITMLGLVFFALMRLQARAAKKALADMEKRLTALESKVSSGEGAFREEVRKLGEEKDLKISQLREDLRSVLNSFVENTGKKLAESAAAQKSRFDELAETIASLQRPAPRAAEQAPKQLIETPAVETRPITAQPVETPTAVPPSADTPAHAKAKRLARLIVSDIVLYNQAAVEEGVRNDTFEELLAHDIREARTLYAQRVAEDIRNDTTYLDDAFAEVIARKKRELNIS